MSGGAGYVLSREALRKFMEEAILNKQLCHEGDDGPEDVQMGKNIKLDNVSRLNDLKSQGNA